ncbi:MAG: tetratricopeptide repeat protein [Treponema sp.]|nr:tetratricopeptide repeat protein [Treponema sp.]
MLKKIFYAVILMFLAVFCFAQSNFSRGEDLLMRNQPIQALEFLARAMADDASNVKTFLYVGIAYEQLGRIDEAIAVYRRALPIAGNLSAIVAGNLGNVYFMRGNIDVAEQYYSQAINFNSVYSSAYLGRANTRIRAGNFYNAIIDYEQYLALEPNSSKREGIQRMVDLIRTEYAAEEMRKIIAEEEQRRLAEERKQLLDAVSASLQSAADASKGISFGTESVEGYDGKFELE